MGHSRSRRPLPGRRADRPGAPARPDAPAARAFPVRPDGVLAAAGRRSTPPAYPTRHRRDRPTGRCWPVPARSAAATRRPPARRRCWTVRSSTPASERPADETAPTGGGRLRAVSGTVERRPGPARRRRAVPAARRHRRRQDHPARRGGVRAVRAGSRACATRPSGCAATWPTRTPAPRSRWRRPSARSGSPSPATRSTRGPRPTGRGQTVERHRVLLRWVGPGPAGRAADRPDPRRRGRRGRQGPARHVRRPVLPGRAAAAGRLRPVPARRHRGSRGPAGAAVRHRPVRRHRGMVRPAAAGLARQAGHPAGGGRHPHGPGGRGRRAGRATRARGCGLGRRRWSTTWPSARSLARAAAAESGPAPGAGREPACATPGTCICASSDWAEITRGLAELDARAAELAADRAGLAAAERAAPAAAAAATARRVGRRGRSARRGCSTAGRAVAALESSRPAAEPVICPSAATCG